MNKMIIILVVGLLLIPLSAIAEMHGSLEFGRDIDYSQAYAKINLDYSFPIWTLVTHIYGGWETWFHTDKFSLPGGLMYDTYLVGLKIDIGDIYIDIHHWCSHPMGEQFIYPQSYNLQFYQGRTVIGAGIKW